MLGKCRQIYHYTHGMMTTCCSSTYPTSAVDTWVGIAVIDVHIASLSCPASFTGTQVASWDILMSGKTDANILASL